ncbi:putative metal-dependent hydrolase [Pseudoxanthomonas japonensis]|uniref:metal-dependent hydrolase n=1 Tax=Pseudoxanthomonas japonensis TaxID=69284 RepID=UPI002863946E|nr:metal-dependent hydrolase [Pseudoxanthomonas japonensis]MDR7068341.1 putative metal-dependent hydrolase [Pseudoxanthomonas japonensis]
MEESITPRRFAAEFPSDVPRHWLPGNEVISSLLNAYTILVPANEAFYIRTLNTCLPRVADEELRRRCQAFIRQEAQHGVAHKRYWGNLDMQGYAFRGLERAIDHGIFRAMDRVAPLWLRASLVSCVEHINAYLGYEFLSQSILAEADPRLRSLMEWHFAEEIEHRAVAFDLLQAISPGYVVRLLGAVTTASLFYLLMTGVTVWLLAQDRVLWRRSTLRQAVYHLGVGHRMARRTLRHLFNYLRPDFHPTHLAGADALAIRVLAEQEDERPAVVVPMSSRT